MNALERVKQAYVYLNERDIPNYFSLMSPDVEFYQTEALPWGGHYRGFDESKVFFSKFMPLIDSTVEIDYYIHCGQSNCCDRENKWYCQTNRETVQLPSSACLDSPKRKNCAT